MIDKSMLHKIPLYARFDIAATIDLFLSEVGR